jgi:holo-[acyl-carrier protein] synthase
VIVGTGVDVATIDRVARLLSDHASDLQRIFTSRERAFCNRAPTRRRAARYAAAFAGKEAVMKALGTGWRSDVGWCDIDTQSDDERGGIGLFGGALRAARDKGVCRVLVSVSITREAAVATALAESEEHG